MAGASCAACGHANREGANFCEDCGAALSRLCAACGAELRATAKFCDGCGARVSPETAGPPAAHDGASLKVVTVVFSDLAGSTALQEELEPESARRVMARFYEAMRAAVQDHGGTLEKFIGDAVVAIFGTPVVREDDALRAVRCGARMASALEALNDQLERDHGVRLRMRTGVNTGELVVSEEGILVGDTMNTAARLEQAAAAGEVLVGEATWRAVRRHVQLEPVAPLALKGKSEPVKAWRLRSTTPAAPRPGLPPIEAPLVGRDEELSRLREAFSDASTVRTCRLVTVVGSPGLGKSRLAQELAQSLRDEAIVVAGHCEPSGEGITFLPVADVLRAAAGIGETDPADVVVEKLNALASSDPERDRVVARAAALLGAGEPMSPEETFWGVRRLLESLARRTPLVVVLDDVHWGQPMFLDLIEHLVEWVRDAPILLVALARPELRELREALASAGRRPVDVIELEPLDPGESRQLVDGLLGRVDLPEKLLDRILDTTDGNPLFLGELLRMLVDDGSLVRHDEVWVSAGGADSVQVPPTIQALLTARIERLRAGERSVVERAAVIGKQFYRGAVAELVAPPVRSEIDGHLETLRRKEMVEPEGTYWIDEPVYRFHHVLIRDAAYHLLLKEARAELHERFADWLEGKAGELVGEQEEVIAYHLEQAHGYRRQLGPLDDRGLALGARAAVRLASAGRRALAREDLAAAANLLARSLARRSDDDPAALWDLAEALLSAGDTAGARSAVDRLVAVASEDGMARADVLVGQLAALTGARPPGDTVDGVVAAAAALAAAGDGIGEAKAHHVAAQLQAQLGRVAEVEASLDRALLAARAAGDRRRITAVLAAAPRAALWGPSPVVRASGRCLDVVRILRMTPGNRHVEAVALRCQAVLEAMRGRFDAAREILAAGRTTLEELGLALELHELAVHAGIVELLAGDPMAADRLLRPARDGFAALGVGVSEAQAAALLARALVEQNRDGEAIAETERAERGAGGDLKTTITWCGVRAEALARGGDLETAVSLARRAVELAEPTDALPDKADAQMALARVLVAAGRLDEARRAAEVALKMYEAKDHCVGVQQAAALAAARARDLGGAGAPEGSADPLLDVREAALARFEELGGRRPRAGGVHPPERFFAEWCRRWSARDIGRIVELYADDYLNADHRLVGWDEIRGKGDVRRFAESAFAAAPDLRCEIDEVLASDDRAIALTVTWRGTDRGTGGPVEFAFGYVALIEDGLLARQHHFEHDAREEMLAMYSELSSRRIRLREDVGAERLFAEHIRLFVARDMALAELAADEFEYVDHRTIGIGDFRGRDRYRRALEAIYAYGLGAVVQEVLASDDSAIAVRVLYTVTAADRDGGGYGEREHNEIWVVEDGRFVRAEHFECEERAAVLARFEELRGLQRAPQRLMARYVDAFNAQDIEGALAILAEDVVHDDRRMPGAGRAHGREAQRERLTYIMQARDLRMHVDEVLACDERVLAQSVTYTWTSFEVADSGSAALTVGHVWLMGTDEFVSVTVFEPGDRQAMIARYAELGGGQGPLGDHPPERFVRNWVKAFAAQDLERLRELDDEQIVFRDCRALAWEDVEGRDAHLELVKTGFTMAPDLRIEVDDVLACDDRVIALRDRYVGLGSEGHGLMEIALGYVHVIRDGRMMLCEQFEHDDVEGMLARYEELGGRRRRSGTTRSDDAFNRRDLAEMAASYAEDILLIDHRNLGWERFEGRDAVLEQAASLWRHMSPDVQVVSQEVLASDGQAFARRASYIGTASDGGGRLDLVLGQVGVMADDKIARLEWFDPDDQRSMIARYAELGGGQSALGDRPPERLWTSVLKAYARDDLEAIVELYADGWVNRDHRPLGWEEMRGAADAREFWRSALATSTAQYGHVDEVLACDARVIAVRITWHGIGAVGGGEFTITTGNVCVIEDGRCVTQDRYEHDDIEGMLGRYAELGGGVAVLGETASERFVAERLAPRFAARDVRGCAELFVDGFTFEDHRAFGWDPRLPRGGPRAFFDSVFEMFPHAHIRVDEVLVADDRAVAYRAAWVATGSVGGGAVEVSFGVLMAVESGRLVTLELFEPDDRAAMLARHAELAGGRRVMLGDRPPERFLARFNALLNAHDLEGLRVCYSEDYVHVDHRSIAWEEMRGRDRLVEHIRSGTTVVPDLRVEIDEVLACDERVIAVRGRWCGTSAESGGPVEVAYGMVRVLGDGCWLSEDLYDSDDRWAMTARYAELGGGMSALGEQPSERVCAEFYRRWASGYLDKLLELCAEDYVHVDHRPIGWEPVETREGLRPFVTSVFGATSGFHCDVDEVLACDERFIALRVTWHGRSTETGSALEFKFGNVTVTEQGLVVRQDLYDYDDRDAMLARYRQLSGRAAGFGSSPAERIAAEYLNRFTTRDTDGLRALLHPEVEYADHRPLGPPPGKGIDGAMAMAQSALGITAELRYEVSEVLHADEQAVAYTGLWVGRAATGQGDVVVPMALLYCIREGKIGRLELFDAEDEGGIRARLDELSGFHALRPYLKFDRLYNERRLDELPKLYSEDYVMVDRRSLGWEEIAGGEALASVCRSFLDQAPDLVSVCEPLVPDDGGDIFLVRNTFTGHGFSAGGATAGEVELVFVEIGWMRADGLMTRTELYDDPIDALVRTGELIGGGRGAIARLIGCYLAAYRDRDWEAMSRLWATDAVIEDHRVAGLGTVTGVEGVMQAIRGLVELTSDARTDARRFLVLTDGVALYRHEVTGHDATGGQVEVAMLVIAVAAGGRMARAELFELDHEAAARARLGDLVGS